MRKLLSTILCCVMLFGLMIPMTVSAETAAVTVDGVTRIEAEDYNSSIQIPRSKGDYTAELGTTGTGWSGTGFMKINSDTATVSTYDVTIPVNVAVAGDYKVKVVMTATTSHSAAELLVNGAVVSTTYTEKAGAEYFNWHSSPAGEYTTGSLTLNSGRNTVGVRLTYRANLYQDFVKGIDYFEIIPATPIVSSTAPTTIEAEDHLDVVDIPRTKGNYTAVLGTTGTGWSGTGFMMINSDTATVTTYDVTIPVNVAEAGNYKVEVVMSTLTNHSAAELLVNGAVVSTTYTQKAGAEYFNWHGSTAGEYATGVLTLNSGRNTVGVRLTYRANLYQDFVKGIDYFEIIPATPVVSSTVPTTIEAEDYNSTVQIPRENSVYSAELGTTGTGWSGTGFMKINSDTATVSTYDVTIPVNVAEAGNYKVEVVMSTLPNHSAAELLVNGAVVSTTYTEKAGTEYFNWHGSTAGAYTTGILELNSGRNTVGVRLAYRANLYQDFVKGIDYFKIIPVIPVEAPVYTFDGETPLRMEFESMIDCDAFLRTEWQVLDAETRTAEEGYNGTVLRFDTGIGGTTQEYFDIPTEVTVAKEGTYNITARWSTAYSAVSIFVNGTDVTDYAFEIDGFAPTDTGILWDGGISEFSLKGIDLMQGTNTIIFRLTNRGDGQIAKTMDYVEIAPIAVQTCDTEMTIELENYTHLLAYNGTRPGTYTNAVASGNGVFVHYKTLPAGDVESIDATIPFTVKESGWFDVEYMGTSSWIQQDGKGETQYTVGGKNVTTNASTDTNIDRNWFTSEGAHAAVPVKYTNVVYLNAGANELVVNVSARQNGYTDVITSLDYFKLTARTIPTTGIVYNDGKVSATYVLDEVAEGTVEGVVILALYNGNEFVGSALGTITDNIATAEMTAEAGTVTNAKLFVWKDYDTTYAPLLPHLEGIVNRYRLEGVANGL